MSLREYNTRVFAVLEKLKKGHVIKSDRQFAIAIGIDPGQFSAAKSGKREIPEKYLEVISQKFNVNIKHLRNGDNPEFVNNEMHFVKSHENALEIGEVDYPIDNEGDTTPFIDLKNGQYVMLVPLVEQYAHAGYLENMQDREYVEDLPKHSLVVNRHHRGKYFAFTVVGDSMNDGTVDAIPEGCIVTGRDIGFHLWNSRFHIHRFKDYVIVHEEGILVKRIINHQVDKGIITCQSLNPDRESYPDFDLHIDKCKQILNIVNVTHIK